MVWFPVKHSPPYNKLYCLDITLGPQWSTRLIVYVTETVFVCLQTSSKPGPALEDGKAVGAVSNPLQAFEQRVKKKAMEVGGGGGGAFVSSPQSPVFLSLAVFYFALQLRHRLRAVT